MRRCKRVVTRIFAKLARRSSASLPRVKLLRLFEQAPPCYDNVRVFRAKVQRVGKDAKEDGASTGSAKASWFALSLLPGTGRWPAGSEGSVPTSTIRRVAGGPSVSPRGLPPPRSGEEFWEHSATLRASA